MAQGEEKVPQTFDQLTRQQLEIYARELHQHFAEERRLRQELERRNRELEQRVQELMALNRLFQTHLGQVFRLLEVGREMVSWVQEALPQAQQVAQRLSALIADLEKPLLDLGPGETPEERPASPAPERR